MEEENENNLNDEEIEDVKASIVSGDESEIEVTEEEFAQFREPIENGGKSMAEKLDEKELVSFTEMLMANSIQVDAVAQLLIEKGIVTEEEF